MPPIVVAPGCSVAPAVLSAVHGAAETQRTLAQVLAWLSSHRPPRVVTEMVTQDEYTHDVVIHFAGPHFLAYDTT